MRTRTLHELLGDHLLAVQERLHDVLTDCGLFFGIHRDGDHHGAVFGIGLVAVQTPALRDAVLEIYRCLQSAHNRCDPGLPAAEIHGGRSRHLHKCEKESVGIGKRLEAAFGLGTTPHAKHTTELPFRIVH